MREVKGVGPRDTKIVIVGEAPGKEEDESGIPFVGASGRLLTRLLNQVGINRSECYITNVVKFRPPNNDLSLLKHMNVAGRIVKSVDEYKNDIRKEVEEIKPNIIIALGNLAMSALCYKDGIYKHRGSLYYGPGGIKVISSLHPAGIMRGIYRDQAYLLFDLMKAKKESEFPEIRIKERTFSTNPPYQNIIDYLHSILSNCTSVSFDIETNRMDKDGGMCYIKCLGFAPISQEAFCIPLYEGDHPVWLPEQEAEIWRLTQLILTNPKITKIIQNMSFELTVLYDWVGEIAPVFDTIIAHHLLQPELKKSLAVQCSLYSDIPFYKDDAKEADYEPTALYLYNCRDTAATFDCCIEQTKELKEGGLWSFFQDYQMKLGRLLWKASMTGILVNTDLVIEYRRKAEK